MLFSASRALLSLYPVLCSLVLPFPLAAHSSDSVPNMTDPPKAGKVELFPEDALKPGMKGIAWTVFQGNKPEPVPVEIVGVARNMWGPRQDIIIGKLTGKAERTNVAGGMSGSPVYIDGKLVGAISLRLSVFSPDAICGITPIRLMLEVSEFDKTRPVDSRTPDKMNRLNASEWKLSGSLPLGLPALGLPETAVMTPIATPVTMSGFTEESIREFAPVFNQLGMTVSQGGVGGALDITKLAKDWASSLQPGDSVAAVLVSGDMTMTGAGT
ncbi:MAG: hypothetical protein JO185_19585, partial [Acidobacteriaceae bacterium]|nr:hypothetical protein [Acidobacteriaceae bacterium]